MIRGLMLIVVFLAGQVSARANEELKKEVSRLIGQLDAPQLAQREAAEAELLRRGPAVLDLLPSTADHTSAEVQQRLGRIRQKLQQAAAAAFIDASTITLHADNIAFPQVLLAFQEQSGNAITIDQRPQIGSPIRDRRLDVDFRKKPFWPALDQLLDQLGLALYPYAEFRVLTVVDTLGNMKSSRAVRASYAGPFRFEPVSITARRDLRERDDGLLVVAVEAAWEPRLRVIGLMQRMADVRAVDGQGRPLAVANREAQPDISVSGEAPAVNLDVPLRLPPRDVNQIALLKGKLTAMILGKVETFRFSKLPDARNVEQRIAGVAVTLEKVEKAAAGSRTEAAAGSRTEDVRFASPLPLGEGQGVRAARPESRKTDSFQDARPHPSPLPKGEGTSWEVRVRVRFDDAGDALASHRQWIFANPAYLEAPDSKPILYDSFETTAQGKNEVGLAYCFHTDRPLSELTFVYKTPGAIFTRSFEYELKDITLP